MKLILTLLILSISYYTAYTQQWIDTTYQINSFENIEYGAAVDFAGTERKLLMDVTVPTNDTPPKCGRPLLIVVHGGAWIGGSKDEPTIKWLRADFAKRGYTTAAVNYRLGQFNTEKNIHCNFPDWDCLNMADSSEWYRAYFRAVQDVNGAIRYLINNAEEWDIDPNNIFLVGESAGAFTSIGVGFIDNENDVLRQYTKELPDVLAPNTIYENPCIKKLGFAESIKDMDLRRDDLGSYVGTLNQPAKAEHRIRAVAGFYGGVLNNIFPSEKQEQPALYMFHQPNDLVVPIENGKVFDGVAKCASGFPFGCQNIISRKFLWGSSGMKAMIDSLELANVVAPQYKIELTNNNADCLQQVADPNKGGHQYDNYWLRSTNAATYFSEFLGECEIQSNIEDSDYRGYEIYPNPVEKDGVLNIRNALGKIRISNVYGRVITERSISYSDNQINLIDLGLSSGVYIMSIIEDNSEHNAKFIVK